MCGLAGIIQKNKFDKKLNYLFLESSKLLNHRGPDYMGVFEFENVLLVHYRLSIIDLNPRSNQPFTSSSKKNVCVYNGEIYNFQEIRKTYEINCFTTSDTEVMIESYERFSDKIVPEWNGIFSTAILNKEKKQISLIRDRFGVKPLYYYENEDVIMFSSEGKVILSFLDSFTLNYNALNQYIWFGNTTGNITLVNDLLKIEPGTITHISLKNFSTQKIYFWRNDLIVESKLEEVEIVSEIQDKLNKAIKRQLFSDAPMGILLSGGVDSSGLVAIANKYSSQKLETYCLDYEYNIGGKSEFSRASLVSKVYSTSHHEFTVKVADIPRIFEKLVFQYDEPFADPAAIPLYLLSSFCSRDKKVILQGDGGDELFAGYSRHNVVNSFNFWKFVSNAYPLLFFNNRMHERLKRLNYVLFQKNDYDIISNYLTVETLYKSPTIVFSSYVQQKLTSSTKWNNDYEKLSNSFGNMSLLDKLLIADMSIILPNRFLEKVDKATMLCSLESRVPYLDNELVELLLSIPGKSKIKGLEKKYLLKKALKGLVPNEILYGKKRGFDVPYRDWLRHDLCLFFKDNIELNFNDFFNKHEIHRIFDLHKNRKVDYGDLLWKILVLSVWLNLYRSKVKF